MVVVTKGVARLWNYVSYCQVNVGEGTFFMALESRSCYHLRRATRLFFKEEDQRHLQGL